MTGAIGSNSALLSTVSSQYQAETAGRATETAPAEKEETRETTEIRAAHGNRDTVTISAEGAAYARQAAAAKANQEGAAATTAKVNDTAVTSTAKAATDTAVRGATGTKAEETTAAETVSSAGEDEDEAAGLSGYTDSELKQMMYKGDITRSEYDEEMLSRNGFTAETETEA